MKRSEMVYAEKILYFSPRAYFCGSVEWWLVNNYQPKIVNWQLKNQLNNFIAFLINHLHLHLHLFAFCQLFQEQFLLSKDNL